MVEMGLSDSDVADFRSYRFARVVLVWRSAIWMGLELFHHNICTLFAEKAPPAPSKGYLMRRNLPARPAPY